MNHKILLIDDDDLVTKTLCKLLSIKGYQVETANNALDAVSKVATTDFDLIISDVRMPGENGIVAIEKIKAIYSLRKVVCGYILISGYSEEDTPAHAIRLGVDKFFNKPFDNETFLKNIEEELALVKKLRSPSITSSSTLQGAPRVSQELKRAVITGIGVVSPNGIGVKACWQGLREGRNCVDFISFFDHSDFPSKVAAEIRDFDPKVFVDDPHQIKRMGRSAHLAVAGARLALDDAGISVLRESEPVDVFIGSATSGLDYAEPEIRALERGGVRRVRPYAGIAGFGGAISGEVSRAVGANGTCITFSNGCTSGTDALGYALKQIRYGLSKVILADACVTPAIGSGVLPDGRNIQKKRC